jgi:capsular polysaccharide biosynthesis protein
VVLIKRSGTRAVSNHDDVYLALASSLRGTHTVVVHRGNNTLAEQLRVFAEADAAVAPHGAGLSLIMGMRRGSGVVEFLTQHGTNLCYLYIALKVKRTRRMLWQTQGSGCLGPSPVLGLDPGSVPSSSTMHLSAFFS